MEDVFIFSQEDLEKRCENIHESWKQPNNYIGGRIYPMQFCPECKKNTMMYVHSFKETHCTNPVCGVVLSFETFDECQRVLTEEARVYRKGLVLAVTEKKNLREHLTNLEEMAKEIHEEFSRASRVHGIIDDEDYAPYEELPDNLKEALMDLAMYLDKNFKRR